MTAKSPEPVPGWLIDLAREVETNLYGRDGWLDLIDTICLHPSIGGPQLYQFGDLPGLRFATAAGMVSLVRRLDMGEPAAKAVEELWLLVQELAAWRAEQFAEHLADIDKVEHLLVATATPEQREAMLREAGRRRKAASNGGWTAQESTYQFPPDRAA